MASHVRNRLEINCCDAETMKKIKMMIFDEDKDKNQIFTMNKMLPLPVIFSGSQNFIIPHYHWCHAMWGTKWDVFESRIIESGSTITIYYLTAWGPNANYVDLLCRFIQSTLILKRPKTTPPISIKLHYYDFDGDFGGIFKWKPWTKSESMNYPLKEYVELYHNGLFELPEFY